MSVLVVILIGLTDSRRQRNPAMRASGMGVWDSARACYFCRCCLGAWLYLTDSTRPQSLLRLAISRINSKASKFF